VLKALGEQPDAVICDLSNVERIDPVCATVFAHLPTSRWPDTSLLLCCLRPAVAVVLRQHGLPRAPPIYDTLDQAVAHARSRPPFLRERLRLVPTLEAIDTTPSCTSRPASTPSSCGRSCGRLGCSSRSTAPVPARS